MIPRVKLIGVGNPFRRDDGVGHHVIDRLGDRLRHCELEKSIGDIAGLLDSFSNHEEVVIVDALDTPAAPGTIVRLNPLMEPLAGTGVRTSSHALGVVQAVEMARTLDSLPEKLTLIGIVGADYSSGEELTEQVRRAANRLCRQLAEEFGHA